MNLAGDTCRITNCQPVTPGMSVEIEEYDRSGDKHVCTAVLDRQDVEDLLAACERFLSGERIT